MQFDELYKQLLKEYVIEEGEFPSEDAESSPGRYGTRRS